MNPDCMTEGNTLATRLSIAARRRPTGSAYTIARHRSRQLPHEEYFAVDEAARQPMPWTADTPGAPAEPELPMLHRLAAHWFGPAAHLVRSRSFQDYGPFRYEHAAGYTTLVDLPPAWRRQNIAPSAPAGGRGGPLGPEQESRQHPNVRPRSVSLERRAVLRYVDPMAAGMNTHDGTPDDRFSDAR